MKFNISYVMVRKRDFIFSLKCSIPSTSRKYILEHYPELLKILDITGEPETIKRIVDKHLRLQCKQQMDAYLWYLISNKRYYTQNSIHYVRINFKKLIEIINDSLDFILLDRL